MKKIVMEFTVKTHLEGETFVDVLWDTLYEASKTFEVMEIRAIRPEVESMAPESNLFVEGVSGDVIGVPEEVEAN